MTMTPADIRALAAKATPGPWSVEEDAHHWELYAGRDAQRHGYKLVKAPKDDPDVECYWPAPADARYIAALDPR